MSEGLVQDKDEKSVNDFQDSDVLEDVLSKTVNARDRKGRQLRRKERLQKKEVFMHVDFLVLLQLPLCCFFILYIAMFCIVILYFIIQF